MSIRFSCFQTAMRLPFLPLTANGPRGPAMPIAKLVADERRSIGRFETADGRTLASGDSVQLGEMIRVRLFVFTERQPPPMSMLYDPISAGVEPINQQFKTKPRQSLMTMLGMGAQR